MSSKKVWIVSLSIAAHVAVFTTAFVTNAWRVERLDPERRSFSLAVLPPPPAPSGGPTPGHKPQDPTPPVKVVTDPTQPQEHPAKPPVPAAATDGGAGTTHGPGTNPDGDPTDTGSCTGPDCGPPTAPPAREPPPPQPPVVVEPTIIPPNILKGNRISGETAISPPDVVKTQMLRDDHHRVVGSFKVCVSEAGRVSSVSVIKPTTYPEYDQRLIAAMRAWRYQPYMIAGRPVPVCSAVSFVYTME